MYIAQVIQLLPASCDFNNNNNNDNLVLDQDRKFYLISWNIYITYLLVNL